MEAAVPFTVGKTCSFRPTEHAFRVTRADVENRTVYELDGKPVLDVYAKALGTTADKLTSDVFMSHPVGLVIDGEPWIRSPQRVLPDGGLKFYCNVARGMKIRIMDQAGDGRQKSPQRLRGKLQGHAGGRLSHIRRDLARPYQSDPDGPLVRVTFASLTREE
jgi:hypothetical protein